MQDPLDIKNKWLSVNNEEENEDELEEETTVFSFEPSQTELPAKTTKIIKVFFKNVDYVGHYYERHLVQAYEAIIGADRICTESQVINIVTTVLQNNNNYNLFFLH